MKKALLLFIFCIGLTQVFAQEVETKKDSITDGWKTEGIFTLLINQSAFSNWQAGGDNSFAGNVSINYDFNYTKDVWIWDNKFIASYGLTNNEDDGARKTDDRLELNSILGRNLKKNWNVSFFMNFKTQFTDGYKYNDDFIGDNEAFPTSGFFKPAYLSFGPGLLWKQSDHLYVNISPLTARFTFITSEVFTINNDDSANVFYESSELFETYGVDPGDSSLFQLGLNIRAYYKLNLMENITMENTFTLFSDYLDTPQNMYIDYNMNLVMKVNDIFSTNLTFQTIYDDNAYSGFQIREVFGLGVNAKF